MYINKKEKNEMKSKKTNQSAYNNIWIIISMFLMPKCNVNKINLVRRNRHENHNEKSNSEPNLRIQYYF